MRVRNGPEGPVKKPCVGFGAGEGNRTPTTSLEGWGSTIELHPPVAHVFQPCSTGALASSSTANRPETRLVEGAGFEPAYAVAGRFTVCCL